MANLWLLLLGSGLGTCQGTARESGGKQTGFASRSGHGDANGQASSSSAAGGMGRAARQHPTTARPRRRAGLRKGSPGLRRGLRSYCNCQESGDRSDVRRLELILPRCCRWHSRRRPGEAAVQQLAPPRRHPPRGWRSGAVQERTAFDKGAVMMKNVFQSTLPFH